MVYNLDHVSMKSETWKIFLKSRNRDNYATRSSKKWKSLTGLVASNNHRRDLIWVIYDHSEGEGP